MGRTKECCNLTTYYYEGVDDCSGEIKTTSAVTKYKINECVKFPVPGTVGVNSAYNIRKCEEVTLPTCEDANNLNYGGTTDNTQTCTGDTNEV